MAHNASTRLNVLDSNNNVQAETVDKDMSDRVVGAIKGVILGGLRGLLYGAASGVCLGVVVASGPFEWALCATTAQCVGAATTVVSAAMGAGRGFITKGK